MGQSKRTEDGIDGLNEEELGRYHALAQNPDGEIMINRHEVLELFREIGRLRLKNAELTRSHSMPKGADRATGLSGAAMPIREVFAARTPNDTRIRHAFEAMGFATLDQITEMTPLDLLARRNFGKRCLARVEEALAEQGLKLRGR